MLKYRTSLLVAAALTIAAPAVAADVDKTFMEKLLAVLDAHPEIAETAVNRARSKAEAEAQKKAETAAVDIVKDMQARDPGMPILGNPAAANTIIELVDYHCGYCKMMHPRVDELMKRRPDTRTVIVVTPVLGQESFVLSTFAMAAFEQGKFAQVHDALFEHEGRLKGSDEELEAIAKKTGVDWQKAKAAMKGPSVMAKMNRTREYWEKLNRPGTPYFLVDGKVIAGATELDSLIAALPPIKTARR